MLRLKKCFVSRSRRDSSVSMILTFLLLIIHLLLQPVRYLQDPDIHSLHTWAHTIFYFIIVDVSTSTEAFVEMACLIAIHRSSFGANRLS